MKHPCDDCLHAPADFCGYYRVSKQQMRTYSGCSNHEPLAGNVKAFMSCEFCENFKDGRWCHIGNGTLVGVRAEESRTYCRDCKLTDKGKALVAQYQ